MLKIKNYFPGFIGQPHVIGEFNEILTLEQAGKPMELRAQLFTGPPGLGKTHVAKKIAEAREAIHGGEHRYLELNGAALTRPDLIKLLNEHATHRPCTIFIDEAHVMDKKIRNLLKSILETGGEIRDVRLSDDCPAFPSNPFQHLWLFASNEDCAAQDSALFGANGRCNSIQFQPYLHHEKRELLLASLKEEGEEIGISSDALDFILDRTWNNARAIKRDTANELRRKATLAGGKIDLPFIKRFCAGELHHVTPEMRYTVARYPLGLSFIDIDTLRFLGGEVRGRQVQDLARRTGLAPKEMGYRLSVLVGMDFIQTLSNGRKGLAPKGADYLAKLAEAQARVQAAAKGAATKKGKATAPAPAEATA